MDYLDATKRLLQDYGIRPRKHLGQNFAVDSVFLQSMISHADLKSDDVVLEVGAGLGFLTSLLYPKCKKLISVEIDPRLVTILNKRLQGVHNTQLVAGDVLTANIPPFDKVVSTPPYSISSPLLFWLLERTFKLAVLVLQEEFAKRLTAAVGSKDYSRLTVSVYYRANVELLDRVPQNCFYPPPDVDSAIVRLRPKPPPFKIKDEKIFYDVLHAVFTQRNKKLHNAIIPFLLKRNLSKEEAKKFAVSLIFHDRRVRELAPEDFGALTNEILEKANTLQ